MRAWRRATLAEPCGSCGKVIAAGSPERVITLPHISSAASRRVRCSGCAGEPVDEERLAIQDEAVEAERPRFQFTGSTRELFDAKAAQLPRGDE